MNSIASRRRLIRSRTAVGAVALLMAAALAACGSDDDAAPPTTGSVATPPATATASTDTEVAPSDSTNDTVETETTDTDSTDPTDSADPTGATDPVSTDSTLDSGPDIDPSSVGTVELVEAGAEPRQEVRLALVEGSTSTFVMTVGLSFDMTFDGDPLPATEIPAMALTTEVVVESVDGNGSATYSFSFTEIEAVEGSADDETIDAMQPILDEMEGVSGRATVDARGQTLAAEMDTSAVDDPAMRAQLDQFVDQVESLTVPFPAEPVGIGARWTSTKQATLNGITTIVQTEYHLTVLTEDGYEFEIVQQQTAETGPIELPTLPAGAEAEMLSTDISGAGTIVGRFDEVVPTSEIESSGDVLMFLEIGSQSGEVVQHLELVLTVERE